MTRIIAGAAGSTTLKVPDAGTRPTSERVREAVFGALDARSLCDDAHVLDLFAGSGALGLEAASRGAASVVLVERSAPAAKVAKANADAVARAGAVLAEVAVQPVQRYLESTSRRFDLVFIDPPYDVSEAELAALLAELEPTLNDDAVVLVERSRRSPDPVLPARLVLDRRRDYGDTSIHWLSMGE